MTEAEDCRNSNLAIKEISEPFYRTKSTASQSEESGGGQYCSEGGEDFEFEEDFEEEGWSEDEFDGSEWSEDPEEGSPCW